MADAVVTVIPNTTRPAAPNNPAVKPAKSVSVVFDGVGDTSEAIEKLGFTISDFTISAALATAGTITFLVSNDGINFVELRNVSIDVSTAGAEGTAFLSGYSHFKVKQATPEAGTIRFGLV